MVVQPPQLPRWEWPTPTVEEFLAWPSGPTCPWEHHWPRLDAAGVDDCERHGCPLCATGPEGGGYCLDCQLLALAVAEHEDPPTDPWCFMHGVPTPATKRSCSNCDTRVRAAKRKGWAFPWTGHDGLGDCAHCWICGLCKGSGRVCRVCFRCPDHLPDPTDDRTWTGAGCERMRWDRVTRSERVFWDCEYWSPETGRWAA